MKTQRFRLILMLAFLAVGGWFLAGANTAPAVSAQGYDLDTTLARSTIRGYFASLTIDTQGKESLANFYLADDLSESDAAQSLLSESILNYEIVSGDWLADETRYQATVSLSPADQQVTVEVAQGESRWQIVSLTLDNASTATSDTDSESDVSGDSSASAPAVVAQAEITSPALNVRSGPGLDYASVATLQQGDVVDVLGVSGFGTWYQISREGETLGWMSTRPDLVSLSPADAELPVISAPSGTGSASGVSSGANTLIVQAQSGGPFYAATNGGNSLTELSHGIDPALSPDGTQVAFTRWDGADLGSLWVYDLASNSERQILGDIAYQPKSPTWSPSGDRIMISYQNGGWRDYRSECTSPGQEIPRNAYDIEYDPVQNKICYELAPNTHWKLRSVDMASGEYTDIASGIYSYAPTWDPAKPWRVVFISEQGLQQVDVNRNEYFDFGPNIDWRDRGPVFSPDGSKVAVTFQQDNFWEVYVIDAATGERTRLTKAPILGDRYSSAAPAWSPDGSQIAFVTDRTGEWEFWVMNADGSNQRPLFPASTSADLDVDYNGVDERLITWR